MVVINLPLGRRRVRSSPPFQIGFIHKTARRPDVLFLFPRPKCYFRLPSPQLTHPSLSCTQLPFRSYWAPAFRFFFFSCRLNSLFFFQTVLRFVSLSPLTWGPGICGSPPPYSCPCLTQSSFFSMFVFSSVDAVQHVVFGVLTGLWWPFLSAFCRPFSCVQHTAGAFSRRL